MRRVKTFTLSELANRSGEVAEAAHRGPVAITRRGKRKFIMLSADHYDAITSGGGRRAVHVDDLSESEAAFYIEALSASQAQADPADG